MIFTTTAPGEYRTVNNIPHSDIYEWLDLTTEELTKTYPDKVNNYKSLSKSTPTTPERKVTDGEIKRLAKSRYYATGCEFERGQIEGWEAGAKWGLSQSPVRGEEGWISVEDRLPEVQEDFIVHVTNIGVDKDRWNKTEKCWMSYFKVTHWQPLPEPPK